MREKIKQYVDEFSGWIKEIPGGWITGFIFILVLALISFFVVSEVHWETKGEIIVDEPKVYTRERLVNDRFREEAWLNEQLTKLKREDFLSPEARMSSARNQQLALAAKSTKTDGNETGQSQAPMQSDAASLEKVPQDIAASPVDTFTDMLDYRDKVRNELMRTQLDDRHDIEGNTLYRLNFDTAIIPGPYTHASAAILVTVTPDDKANNTKVNKEAFFKEWAGEMQTLVDSLIFDKTKLFEILSSDTTKYNPFSDNDPFPSDEQAIFEGFLRNKICEEVKTLSEKLYQQNNPSKQEQIICSAPKNASVSSDPKNTSASDVFYDCTGHDNPFFCEVEKLIGSYSLSFDQAKNNKSVVHFFEDIKKHTGLTEDNAREFSHKILQACLPTPDNEKPNDALYKAMGHFFEVKPYDKKSVNEADFRDWQSFPCFQSPKPTNRLIVVMGLLERLSAVSAIPQEKIRILVKTYPVKIEWYPRVVEELTRPYVCGKPDEKTPFFHQDSYKYIGPYTENCELSPDYPDEGLHRALNNLKQLIVNYQAIRLGILDDYFTAVVEGCDMQKCRLVLTERPGANELLMEKLTEKVTQTFSYAVTPQIQTQRIALLNKQKQQLNILISAALQGDGNKAEGLMQQLSTLEKELEILERYPLVIGFGDWQYEEKPEPFTAMTLEMQTQRIELLKKQKEQLNDWIKTSLPRGDNHTKDLTRQLSTLEQELDILDREPYEAMTPQMQTQYIALLNKQKEQLITALLRGDNHTKDLTQQLSTLEKELEILDRELNTETRFGWVIQPRLTGGTALSGNPEFRQLPGHYQLSALISIPSWWHAVNVQVNKCWLTEPKLGAIISSLCDSRGSQSPSFTIKVPGHPHEINQKLRYEVFKTPYLSHQNYDPDHKQEIEVGRKGVLLLEGIRLWRSTVVLLGNQKADSIEVLPDMKAVMATFQCVKPAAGDTMPAYKDENKDVKQAGVNTSGTNNTGVLLQGPLNSLLSLLAQQPKEQEKSKKTTDDASSKDSPHNSANHGTDNPVGREEGKSQNGSAREQSALVRLWTSEGNTDSMPLLVTLKPFVQRYPGDKPCYEIEANEQESQIK